jgi:hypothetical protein
MQAGSFTSIGISAGDMVKMGEDVLCERDKPVEAGRKGEAKGRGKGMTCDFLKFFGSYSN